MPFTILALPDEGAFRARFNAIYGGGSVITHDGIEVRFRPTDFDHCCYKSTRRNGTKDAFCPIRAERLEWIFDALKDPSIPLHVGWDNKRKCLDPARRVSIVRPDFAVVIEMKNAQRTRAYFVTAFVADPQTIARMLGNPPWT